MKIIGLTGPAGCGKSTVADILTMDDGFGFIEESFARPLREFVASVCCWPFADVERTKEEPTPRMCGRSPREVMQLMGTEFGRNMIGPDIWIRALESRIQRIRNFVDTYDPRVVPVAEWWSGKLASGHLQLVISDVRFANEAAWIREHGELWHLSRPGKGLTGHASESGVTITDRDQVLDNDCDLEVLRVRIGDLLGVPHDR